MLNINDIIFKKYSKENKLKILNELNDTELLRITPLTMMKMVKRVGKRVSAKHTTKRIYFNASNNWNSSVTGIEGKGNKYYFIVYLQGHDTDGTDYCPLEKFKTQEIVGRFTEYDRFDCGYERYARYNNHDKAEVYRALCKAYVNNL